MMVEYPAHRRHGAGSLMISWGNTKIGEMDIESFIEASEPGRGLYEVNGYTTLMKLLFCVPSRRGEDWNKDAHQFTMQDFYCTWRPKGGVAKGEERMWPW